MTYASRQQYCNGSAPYEVRGRKTTCRKYAAMREVHEYIRSMRTGFTIQRYDEYLRLRKAMRLYREFGNKSDDATMEKIAVDHGLASPDTANKTYRKALGKMEKEFKKKDILSNKRLF